MGDWKARWNSGNLETEGVIRHETYVEVEDAHPVVGFLRINAPLMVGYTSGKPAELPEKEYHRISSLLLTTCCNSIRYGLNIK